jgi:hypothetical protein
MGVYYESVPNVTTVEGGDNERLVTQKLEVTDWGVRLLCRGGVMGGPRDIEIGYSELVGVERQGRYTYELVLRTRTNTYTVTNVTSNEREIDDTVDYIQDHLDRAASPGTSGSSAADRRGERVDGGTRATEGGDSGASGSDGTAGGGSGTTDVTDQLRRFAELRDDGILTEEEFERKKKELLES